MATKTFEELKQLAIQIRDEKTNKQNTATRVGTAMLEHINKLEQDYYDKTKTDEELKERDDKLTELSNNVGLYNVDKNVPIGSGFYTSTTARAAVPTSVRKLGLIITYKTDETTSVTEQFIGSDMSGWATDTNWKNVGSEGGNKILEWNTDVATTRKQVPSKERKLGMQISYKPTDSDWVNEQYTGTSTDDRSWGNDTNWRQIQTQNQSSLTIDNLFFINKGYYINQQGNLGGNASFSATDYIPVDKGMRIFCNYETAGYTIILIAAYDESKTYISEESSATGSIRYCSVEIKTAKFVRICGLCRDNDSVVITGADNRLLSYYYQFLKDYTLTPIENSINANQRVLVSEALKNEYKLDDYSNFTASPIAKFGYKNTTIFDDYVVKKIHLFALRDTATLYIGDNIVYELSNLVPKSMNDCDVDIPVKKDEILSFAQGDVGYKIDNSSYFTFCKNDGTNPLAGYMGYWIEYAPVSLYSIENIKENLQYSKSLIGTNTAIAKHWDAGEDETGIISNGFTKDETGLLLSSTATSFSYTRLSVQTIYLKFKVTSESEFKVRSANNDNEPGCTISFANGKITDLKNPENTVDIPSDFLVADTDNEVCVNFIENNEKHKIILSCDKTSSVVELELTEDIFVNVRVINVLAVAGTVYLISYRLILPTDLDIIFTGDSITEGVGTDKTYAMLFKEKTNLKVATYALGGSTLGAVGSECVELCAPLKPKVISAMFGMNGGNSLKTFRRHQEICDRYFVAYVVHYMPAAKSTDFYKQQAAITEQFLNEYAHIKYSARFDIATSLNGNPDDGYNPTYGDGKHPNTNGHVKMYNRLRIDTPALFSL